jgi:hypothetical protein
MPLMNPISAAELTALRAEVPVAALDTSCAIQRRSSTVTSDGMAQNVAPFSTIATVGAGMKQPSAQHLANYDYLVSGLSTWEVHFAYGTDVRVGDHLVMGSDTLVVQADLSLSSYTTIKCVLASEVK